MGASNPVIDDRIWALGVLYAGSHQIDAGKMSGSRTVFKKAAQTRTATAANVADFLFRESGKTMPLEQFEQNAFQALCVLKHRLVEVAVTLAHGAITPRIFSFQACKLL